MAVRPVFGSVIGTLMCWTTSPITISVTTRTPPCPMVPQRATEIQSLPTVGWKPRSAASGMPRVEREVPGAYPYEPGGGGGGGGAASAASTVRPSGRINAAPQRGHVVPFPSSVQDQQFGQQTLAGIARLSARVRRAIALQPARHRSGALLSPLADSRQTSLWPV